jgi:hypothetical protein
MACDEGGTVSSAGATAPSHTWDGPPWLGWQPGERYFLLEGRAQPLVLRNISAPDEGQFAKFFDLAKQAGTRIARIHLTQGMGSSLGIDAQGGVTQTWVSHWDSVFDAAASRGLSVIPVFGIWGDWNDGRPDMGWANWSANPLSRANGGPAAAPADLFGDTAAHQAWLTWLGELVARWQARSNLAAWELFSELDLVSGADQAAATAWAELAVDVVRSADSYHRPVLASTSDLVLWPELWASRANDMVELHPYGAELDLLILDRVPARLLAAGKPVMVGESGLSAAAPDGTTLTSAPRADLGLRHAIWAGLVAGASTVRAFWWEDSYAVYYPGSGLPLVDAMATLEASVPDFLGNTDCGGLEPAVTTQSASISGAALARSDLVLAWFRDAGCVPPDWTCGTEIAGATVSVTLPNSANDAAWSVTIHDPVTGNQALSTASVSQGTLTLTLPPFRDAVALRAEP